MGHGPGIINFEPATNTPPTKIPTSSPIPIPFPQPTPIFSPNNRTIEITNTRQSSRISRPPTYLKYYHCSLLLGSTNFHNPPHSSITPYPISDFITYNNLSSSHSCLI